MNAGLKRPVRMLDRVVRVANVPITQYDGPAPRAACPCGSGQPARRCHLAEDLSWIAQPPPPLLTGPRTGYSNPGCYGRASNDCDHELTREHFITDDVLGIIANGGKVVVVEGAAWQGKVHQQKSIGRGSLSSRMLCRRHNTALSPLDVMAADYLRHFLDDQIDIFKYLGNDTRGRFDRGFILTSGPYFELWLLKVLWGAIEAGALALDGSPAYRFRLGVTTEQLAEILWRGADWPSHWGMYVLRPLDPDEPVIPRAARLRLAHDGSEVLGGFVQVCQWEYLIAFERPPVDHFFRPAGFAFRRVGFPTHCCKLAAFAWPESGHPKINAISASPPSEDYSKPSTTRAAAMQNRIVRGSLNVTSRMRS
jgi:hypothetical protein